MPPEPINSNPLYDTMTCSSATPPSALGGALARAVRKDGAVYVEAIGAGAVNQTVKAIIVARGYCVPGGFDLTCKPNFAATGPEGEERTLIRFLVEKA